MKATRLALAQILILLTLGSIACQFLTKRLPDLQPAEPPEVSTPVRTPTPQPAEPTLTPEPDRLVSASHAQYMPLVVQNGIGQTNLVASGALYFPLVLQGAKAKASAHLPIVPVEGGQTHDTAPNGLYFPLVFQQAGSGTAAHLPLVPVDVTRPR